MIKRIKNIETKDIIEQAEKFYKVAVECIGEDYCDDCYVGNRPLSNEEVYKYIFPKEVVTATVNLSFCCELLLKSMLNQGITIKNHKLRELYDKLDDRWKNIIKSKMNYDSDSNNKVFYLLLDGVSDSFEKWRYIYESEQSERDIYFSFLKDFGEALMSVANMKYYYERKEYDKIDESNRNLIKKYFN